MRLPTTPSQTVGPFFSIGLSYRDGAALCAVDAMGEHVEILGQVLDAVGAPVPDAQLELWQADCNGRFVDSPLNARGDADKDFQGFARIPTDERGAFRFRTVRPGAVPAPNGASQAPHIVVLLLMRGILRHLVTRIYFAEDPLNNADPILAAVPMERRSTLLAQPTEDGSALYRWDIRMQGDDETVFFAH